MSRPRVTRMPKHARACLAAVAALLAEHGMECSATRGSRHWLIHTPVGRLTISGTPRQPELQPKLLLADLRALLRRAGRRPGID